MEKAPRNGQEEEEESSLVFVKRYGEKQVKMMKVCWRDDERRITLQLFYSTHLGL